jgi:hypothetical protein
MKIRHYLSFFLVIATLSSYTQSRWLQEYFPEFNALGKDFVESYDKGYLLTGWFGPNYPNYTWLIKTDINGTVIWNKTFGLATTFIAFLSLDEDTTGNIFLSGGTGFYDSYSDPMVMKLNACGEKEWCLDFSTPQHYDYAHSIVATNDGGCAVILRYTGVSPPQTDRICLAKIDADGYLLWKQCYNSQDTNLITEDSRALLRTPDKGYLITGVCDYYDVTHHLHPKQYYIKTDSLGNFQWETVVNSEDNTNGGDAWTTFLNPDSTFYYSSVSHYYFASNLSSPALIKLDLGGNVIGIYDIVNGYINGGLAYAQFINDSTLAADCGWGNTQDDIRDYAVLIDTLGNLLDSTFIVQDIYGSILRLCHNNKLAFVYNTYQNNQFDVFLRKLNYNLEDDTLYTLPFTYDSLCPYQIVSDTIVQDDCGLIVGIEEEEVKGGQGEEGKRGRLEVWPNPGSGIVNCQLSIVNCRGDLQLMIYDVFGREVDEIKVPDGQNTIKINVESYPPGVYIVILKKGFDLLESSKFVIAR